MDVSEGMYIYPQIEIMEFRDAHRSYLQIVARFPTTDGSQLPADHHATATFGGNTYDLARQEWTSGTRFEAILPATAVSGVRFDVRLVGEGFDATSTVTMPADFTLSISGSLNAMPPEEVSVTWSPTSTDTMQWRAYNPTNHASACGLVGPVDPVTTPDDGMLLLPAGTVYIPNPIMACHLVFRLARSREGFVDPPFASGRIAALQVREGR
jgi:hypothetical protein